MNDQNETKLDEIKKAYHAELPALTMELARRFIRENPADHRARTYLGIALRDLRRFDESKREFEDALLLYPGDHPARIYREMGHLFELKGACAEAERWYRKAIEADPGNAGHYVYLGVMYARLGRFRDAEDQHRRATACESGCVDEAYLNLGLVLRAQERYVEAYDCFQTALEMDPEYDHAKAALEDLQRVIDVLGA
jgi:tetratricopeptide (TPR) repeat protein